MKRKITISLALIILLILNPFKRYSEASIAGFPVMQSVSRESNTTLKLYFNEPIQIIGTYTNEFSLSDCKGTVFAVSAIADNIAGDNQITLTTNDLSTANGDLQLTFFNLNDPVQDLDGNALDTNGIGLTLFGRSQYNISTTSYDSQFYTITEDTDPRAYTFNNDGTKVFVLGRGVDGIIYEYNLSTPYKIQSMSFTGSSLDVANGVNTGITSLTFDPSGTKLFMVEFNRKIFIEYSLSSAFDLSTATFVNSYSTLNIPVTAFSFSADGAKIFILTNSANRLYQYTLSAPYTLGSLSSQVFFNTGIGVPIGFDFNHDGSKIFIIGRSGRQIRQHTLSAAYDISVIQFEQQYNISATIAEVATIAFNNDGTRLYALNTGTDKSIFQFNIGDSQGPVIDQIALTSLTEIEVLFDEPIAALQSNPSNFSVFRDGVALTVDQVSDPNPGDQSVTLILNAATTLAGVTTSVQVTYADSFGNGEISDFVCNVMEDDPTGVTLPFDNQAPNLLSAAIQDSQTILLTFDEIVQTSGNNASNFTITDCRGITYTAQAIKDETPGDNLLELLTDDLTFRSGDLLIDYTDPGNDAIFDGFLNTLVNLTTTIASSISDFIPPTMAGFSKNSPTEVTVTFSENVSSYEQFPLSFTVSDGANLYQPTAILNGVEGDNIIKLPFGSPIAASSELTITYNNGSGNNEISDFSCNALASNPTGITINLETIAPVLRIVQEESSTEISLYFDEIVQLGSGISGANFVLADCDATVFNVTAVDDGTLNDNRITLTVDDLSGSNGELSLQVTTNNFEITDLSGNTIAGNSVTFAMENNFNMTNAVFAGSTEQFNFTTEDTFPISMAFDGSGMNMYMVGNDNKVIHRYQLASAYDVSSAVLTTDNLDVSTQTATPLFIGFNPTGTRLYLMGVPPTSGVTWVSQFDLSTAYDITTAVFAGSLDTNSVLGEDIPTGLEFNANGSKLLVIGAKLDMVLEYDLSTNYDVSSATYAGNTETLDVSIPSGGVPVSMVFDDSGLVMWVLSNNNNEVVKFLLDSPYDVSTAIFTGASQTFNFTQDSDARRLIFNNDGSKAFILGAEFDNVYEFELLDSDGPAILSATLINSTTIELTFDEPVKAAASFPEDFAVTDLVGFGNLFTVSAITDATPGDEILTLTVSDLSTASGDIQITYDNLNNEIADLNCNDMLADPSGVGIDLDMTAPTVASATVDNSTQVSVTFSEPVQTLAGNPADFVLTDGAGSTYNVTAQSDGVAQDNVIVLTTDDLSSVLGDLLVTYANNNQEISDFGNNDLATDAQGVSIDLDQTSPSIAGATLPTSNSILLTFDEEIKINGSVATDFSLVDASGTSFGLSGLFDTTPLDDQLELALSVSTGSALGDLFVNYTNNNNVVDDFGGNSLQSTASDVVIDIDQTAPTIVSVTKDSDTQLTLTFSEIVQTSGSNANDFEVIDDQGTAISVTSIADGTAQDEQLILTVSSLSVVNNDVTVTFIGGNGVVSDFGSNDLATDNVGVNLDIVAPDAPVVTGISDDTGASSTDGITNDNNLLFEGTAEANSTIELFSDGVSSATMMADGAGSFTFDFTSTAATDGTYSLTAIATDATGNTGATSQAFTLTIDTNTPTVSTLLRNQSGKLGSEVTSAEFAIVLSESVSGIDATDFEVVVTGTSTGQVGTVTVVSVNEAIIEVTGISGEGTIGLNLKDDDSIEDTAGNTLGGAGLTNGDFTGEIYETKASQTITFSDPAGTYGGVVTLSATASSSLAVTYSLVSGPAALAGDQLTITGVGQIEVEATQLGDADFNAAVAVTKTFTPSKASLTITSDDHKITFGDALPGLTITYAGFIGSDAIGDLDTEPSISTTATAISDAGNYLITLSGGADSNYSYSFQDGTLTINQAAQTINFATIADIDLATTSTVSLVATSSSGLIVDFSLTQGDGTISGTTLTANTTGIFTLEATQAGNTNYATATTFSQTFNVNDSRKTDQIITFATLVDKAYGDAPFTISAVSHSSLPVTFTVSGPATLNGSDLTLTGTGIVSITASQAGDGTFNPAQAVVQDFAVSKAAIAVAANDQTMIYGDALPTLDGILTGVVGSDNISVSHTTTAMQTSDVAVYSITTTLDDPDGRLIHYDVTNTDGELTIAKADLSATANNKTVAYGEALPTFDGTLIGVKNSDDISVAYSTVAMVGSDVGDYDIDITLVDPNSKLSNYNQSIQVGVLSITTADQLITFDPIADVDLAAVTTVNLTASTSSGLDITHTLTSGDGAISGSVLTINATGNFTIEALQVGDNNFNAAMSVTQSFQASDSRKTDQTITFGAIADQVYGDQVSLTGTASSTLIVTYVLTAGTGSITNSMLTIEDVGSYTITASQTGNSDFNPAVDVIQSFTVAKAKLTARADDQSILVGDPVPVLTITYSGFVLTDDLSVIDTEPTIRTTATSQSSEGNYTIELIGGTDDIYDFNLINSVLTITQILGIPEVPSLEIYPNPVTTSLFIKGDQIYTIELIDLTGKRTFKSFKKTELDLREISKGTYIVVFRNREGEVTGKRKLIKN